MRPAPTTALDAVRAFARTPALALAGALALSACDGGQSTVPTAASMHDESENVTYLVGGITYPLVKIEPRENAMTVGQTATLHATVSNPSSSWTGREVSYTSSNASVVSVTTTNWGVASGDSGRLVANNAGSAVITATTQSGTRDTLHITVNAHSTSMAECATPQAGWIWCDDFESDRTGRYFEYVNAGGHFVRVSGAGVNGSWGMRAEYLPGTSDAGNLKLAFGKTPSSYFKAVDAGAAQYRDIYWRVYVRNQPGWTGGGADKLSRALVFANSNWAEAAFAQMWSGTSGAGDPNQLLLNPASGTNASGNLQTTSYNDFAHMRWLGTDVGPLTLYDASHVGQWYCVETHAKLNDPGQSNGVFEFWINGTPQASQTGMNWLGSYTAYGWNAVFLENYWNAGSPVPEYRYLDDFVVSTQRIGCRY